MNKNLYKQSMSHLKTPADMNEKTIEFLQENKSNDNAIKIKPKFSLPKNKLIRVALVAVISVFMTVTVLAVVAPEVLSELISGKQIVLEGDDTMFGGPLEIFSETKDVYPFSDELREYIQNNDPMVTTTDVDIYNIFFTSIDEVSDFFGVPIIMPDNFDYSSSLEISIIYSPTEDWANGIISASLNDVDGENTDLPPDLLYQALFSIGDREDVPFDGPVVGLSKEYDVEIYTTPTNGIEMAIYFNPLSEFVFVNVSFTINEVWYSYSMSGGKGGDEEREEIIEILKNLVDSIK